MVTAGVDGCASNGALEGSGNHQVVRNEAFDPSRMRWICWRKAYDAQPRSRAR